MQRSFEMPTAASAIAGISRMRQTLTEVAVRHAKTGEVEVLLGLVRDCIGGMRSRGIDQWDNDYPDYATLKRDIDEGTACVATIADVPVGMAVLNEYQEPEYADVPWLYDGRPAVVHRLMVSPSVEGTGVARTLMVYLESQAQLFGFDCIRLDVFSHNPRAILFYERFAYRVAGEVRFRKGDFYCLEKRLRPCSNEPDSR